MISAARWPTYALFGLRYPREMAEQLLRGVRKMPESVTYRAILDEGRAADRAAAAVRTMTGRWQRSRSC